MKADSVDKLEYEDKIGEIVSEHKLPDCDLLGFCPFDNKKDGFPCKYCIETRKQRRITAPEVTRASRKQTTGGNENVLSG